jgi:hypothetical protein
MHYHVKIAQPVPKGSSILKDHLPTRRSVDAGRAQAGAAPAGGRMGGSERQATAHDFPHQQPEMDCRDRV